jgi:hypothetical protein
MELRTIAANGIRMRIAEEGSGRIAPSENERVGPRAEDEH